MNKQPVVVLSVLLSAGFLACSDTAAPPSSPSGSSSGASGSSSSSSGGSSSGDDGPAGSSSSSSSSSSSGGSSSGSGDDSGGAIGDDSGGSPEGGSSSGGSSSGSSSGGGTNPYNDPNLVSLFNGTDLTGWSPYGGGTGNFAPAPGSWVVMGGAIHSLANVRGFLATNATYDNFRFIFTERLITTAHQACVLLWGASPPAPLGDADSGIQFQVPNGGHWDYRPGTNTAGAGFTNPTKTAFMATMWNQCEILANITTGTIRQACCQITGTMPCKGVENLDFKNTIMTGAAVPKKGPLALQCHTGGGATKGSVSEFKDLYVETNPTQQVLITTQ